MAALPGGAPPAKRRRPGSAASSVFEQLPGASGVQSTDQHSRAGRAHDASAAAPPPPPLKRAASVPAVVDTRGGVHTAAAPLADAGPCSAHRASGGTPGAAVSSSPARRAAATQTRESPGARAEASERTARLTLAELHCAMCETCCSTQSLLRAATTACAASAASSCCAVFPRPAVRRRAARRRRQTAAVRRAATRPCSPRATSRARRARRRPSPPRPQFCRPSSRAARTSDNTPIAVLLKQAGRGRAGALRGREAQARSGCGRSLSGPSATQRYRGRGRRRDRCAAARRVRAPPFARPGEPASQSAPAHSALGVGDVVGVDDAPGRGSRWTRATATTATARRRDGPRCEGATSAGTLAECPHRSEVSESQSEDEEDDATDGKRDAPMRKTTTGLTFSSFSEAPAARADGTATHTPLSARCSCEITARNTWIGAELRRARVDAGWWSPSESARWRRLRQVLTARARCRSRRRRCTSRGPS